VVGSPGFLPNYVIDYAGNLGTIPVANNCSFIATIIGSAIEPGPWEMQVGTVETIAAHEGTISANFAANAAAPTLSTFMPLNTVGYLTGVVSGTGTWTIRSGPDSIDGVNYIGTGLLVTSGANTHSGLLTLQDGTKLQLGADCTNTATRARGALTIGAAATCTQFTAYTVETYLSQNLNNNGTYNVIGCGECGSGLGVAAAVTNNGTINIDYAIWANRGVWAGTGTVNVKGGGTFQMSANGISSTTRFNINGDGWCNASGVKLGAIQAVANGFTYQARIHVETAATIKTAVNVNATFAGLLTGNAPLTLGNLGTPVNGVIGFSNTANTYHGVMTVDGTTVQASYGNSMQYTKVVLVNGGRLGTNATQTIGSLASADLTTYWASADFLNNYIKENGITTYAGRLLWNGGTNTANYWLEGPSTNELTLTRGGHTGNIYARNGARLILQGAGFTGTNGQARILTGGTISAGTSTTAAVTYLQIDAASNLEVRAAGAGASKINVGTYGFVAATGWTVNVLDAMAPGEYPIISSAATISSALPTLGVNNTGRSVSFAYNNAVSPKLLNMTLV
jgi:hypothetical protein